MGKPKYKTCMYAVSSGQIAVDVLPQCRHMHLIKGRLVTSKQTCEKCIFWKPKENTNG